MQHVYPISSKKIGIAVATSFFALFLTACGQKGDLYLPDNQHPTVAVPQATSTDTAAQPQVTGEAQNPNITSTAPTDPQTTAQPSQPNQQGQANDY